MKMPTKNLDCNVRSKIKVVKKLKIKNISKKLDRIYIDMYVFMIFLGTNEPVLNGTDV